MRTAPVLPGSNGTHLVEAGVDWDVVRVSRHLGLQALDRLDPGSLVVAPSRPDPALHFFVVAGSTYDWHVAQTSALRRAAFVLIPPADRLHPPGPYWLVPPGADGAINLTDLDVLRDALNELLSALPDTRGSR
ncbi:hypothetical protein [Streptomyces sp. NPDC047315]|uniref:hypothetical protein n=1 Tax=Streptomyces sp. NPDC047315 TaxID=3155142 RepID=UPI0033FDB4B4